MQGVSVAHQGAVFPHPDIQQWHFRKLDIGESSRHMSDIDICNNQYPLGQRI